MAVGLSGAGVGPGTPFTVAQAVAQAVLPSREWRLTFADDDPALKGIDGQALYVYHGDGPDSVRYAYAEDTVVVATQAPEPHAFTVPGQPLRVEVSATFRATDFLTDLAPIRRRLERMREVIPSLGRKPLLRWEYGDDVVTGQLASLEIEPSTERWINGALTAFAVRFSLIRRRELQPDYATPSAPEPSTVHLTLAVHETFEWIAAKLLGDPDLGAVVRRYNPQVDDEEGGQEVIVLPRGHSANRRALEPVSAPFVGAWKEHHQVLAEGLTGGVRRWDALPAELKG